MYVESVRKKKSLNRSAMAPNPLNLLLPHVTDTSKQKSIGKKFLEKVWHDTPPHEAPPPPHYCHLQAEVNMQISNELWDPEEAETPSEWNANINWWSITTKWRSVPAST